MPRVLLQSQQKYTMQTILSFYFPSYLPIITYERNFYWKLFSLIMCSRWQFYCCFVFVSADTELDKCVVFVVYTCSHNRLDKSRGFFLWKFKFKFNRQPQYSMCVHIRYIRFNSPPNTGLANWSVSISCDRTIHTDGKNVWFVDKRLKSIHLLTAQTEMGFSATKFEHI